MEGTTLMPGHIWPTSASSEFMTSGDSGAADSVVLISMSCWKISRVIASAPGSLAARAALLPPAHTTIPAAAAANAPRTMQSSPRCRFGAESMTRFALLVGAALAASSAWGAADRNLEQQEVERWRVARVQELVSEDGWLTLVGLYWLDPGRNSFGRAPDNHLVLDHPALSEHAGTF